mmetsp:Transcript_51464/g.112029  ORF Transcript_51464/g.112029 Transcript_51464/m.112029 type:complete len:279 (+) Transcript_51464:868-1704(+)
MRQAGQVRHGPHHLVRPAGRRVPAHDLPHHRERQPAVQSAARCEGAWPHAARDQHQGQIYVHIQAVRHERRHEDPAAEEHGRCQRQRRLGQVPVRARAAGHHLEAAPLPRRHRVLHVGRGGDDVHHGRQGVEQTANHNGLPSAHVCSLGPPRPLPQGLREEQLPDNQVGALHHQGGAVPAPHLRLAWGAPSGGRSPQRAQAAHPGPSSVGIHPFHLAARVPLPRKWNAHCCWRWGIMGRGARLTRAIPRTRGKARARRKVLGGVSRVPFTAAGRLTCV